MNRIDLAALPWQYQGLKDQSLTNKEGTTADSIQRTTDNEALCVVRIRLLCLFGYFFWPPLKALIVCCMLALEPQGSNTFIVRCDFGSDGKCLNSTYLFCRVESEAGHSIMDQMNKTSRNQKSSPL